MKISYLPKGGTNLFQGIKARKSEAVEKGIEIINLAIGQPSGPALLSARRAAAKAIMSSRESMHEYQDNGSPGVPGFAKDFIDSHFNNPIVGDVAYLPTPGSKAMLGLIPLACGAFYQNIKVATVTDPGYPTPATWCKYLKVAEYPLKLNIDNQFMFSLDDIKDSTILLMLNYPHNPSGQIATKEDWVRICKHCEENDIRIFNDNPYYILSYSEESYALCEVAPDFPNLSWAEAFSASKVISNGTGWRVGAIIGSPDFIGDIATIKGNTDSGFVAPMACGVLEAIKNDKEGILKCRQNYIRRKDILIDILSFYGMQLAVKPGAGFFTLWKTPTIAFGEEIKSAEQFNFLMIEKTGVVGVHFNPYIRYAVTGDVEGMRDKIAEAFEKANVSYK